MPKDATTPETRHIVHAFKTLDAERMQVCGVVYAPGQIDTHGEMMTSADVELMAHRFMSLKLADVMDTGHDRVSNGCTPIESWIAGPHDPNFPEGAWVLRCQCTPEVWARVKSGELNGYSFDAMVVLVDAEVELTAYSQRFGTTEAAADGHTHEFAVLLDDKGNVIRGGTTASDEDGHSHEIAKSSVTMSADGHTHRYFFL